MNRNEIKIRIAKYIIKNFSADEDIYVDYTPLSMYMDSLDMVQLIGWIESQFNIEVPADLEFWNEWHNLNDVVKGVEEIMQGKR